MTTITIFITELKFRALLTQYFDIFMKLDVDYDKRNQKFQTTEGFRSTYSIDLPVVSNNYTLTNTYISPSNHEKGELVGQKQR